MLLLPGIGRIFRRGERRREIVLGDFITGAVDHVRRFGAAERTDQFLRGWIPFRLRAAGRTGVLVERPDVVCQNYSDR
jgi:hypothetical protein